MKRLVSILALVGVLLMACVNVSFAAPKYTLRAAHYFNNDFAWQQGLEYMAKVLEEKTNGQVKLTIFNNGVLGSEADYVQYLREGTLDFAVADPGAGSVFAKELDFFVMPFLFKNLDHWKAVLDGEPGRVYADLIERKASVKILAYWGGSPRYVLSTKRPILSMGDMKGFKLRLVNSPLKMKIWSAVGAIPTPIAYLETYSAMQAGVVDGMENEPPTILQMKFYEPAPYITMTAHEITVRPLFMSLKTWNKLPADIQKVIVQAAKEATVVARQAEQEQNKKAVETMRDKFGVKFYTIDMTPFLEATAPVQKEFASQMGLVDLFEQIRAMGK